MLTPEEEKRAYEMDEDELIRLANEQLAKQNPNPVDPNPSGRTAENEGRLGRIDGLIHPDRMRRPDSLDPSGEAKETDAPNRLFWSSAVPGKSKK